MRPFSDGPPPDPRVLCVALALWEALPVFPADEELADVVLTMVAEAERYQPDMVRLYRAWKLALTILSRMLDNCDVGPLGMFFIENWSHFPSLARGEPGRRPGSPARPTQPRDVAGVTVMGPHGDECCVEALRKAVVSGRTAGHASPRQEQASVTDPYAVPKPAEFVALGPLLELLFIELKHSRAVPDTHTFDLRHVDCADAALRDWSSVAAFALRKLQALRYLTKTGVRTRNSIVVILVADLNISLTDLAEEAERTLTRRWDSCSSTDETS